MNNRTSRLYSSVSMAAVMALTVGAVNPANAQDSEDLEEIVVTGIRGGLKQALNVKRNATAQVDAISAEDIGKFPDKNVAESLQRIPGVTIQRSFGEGSDVSIRGAGAGFTKTSLNGQNVASTGWFVFEPARRSFNYTLLPSELVGDIEVYKSSQADLVEGGVGGTVIINTRKPLDLDSMTMYGSAELARTDDSSTTDPQVSGMFSWKNDEETFGVLVSGVYQRRQLQRQGSEAFWEWGAGPVAFQQDRKRRALTAAIQFTPNESTDVVVNLVDMEMGADNVNSAFWLTMNNCSWCANPGPSSETRLGTYVEGQLNVGVTELRPRQATMKSRVYDIDVTHEGDGYTVEFQAGHTEASGGTDLELLLGGSNNADLTAYSYDYTGDTLEWDLGGFDIANFDAGALNHALGESFNKTPKTDQETYIQSDVTYDVEYGAINSIKAGVRYSDHNTVSRRFVFDVDPAYSASFTGVQDGLLDVGYRNMQMPFYDMDSVFAAAKNAIIGETEDLGAYSQIDEKNLSLYAMANFEGDSFRGNVGVRWVSTDATSTYYLDGVRGQAEASYNKLLPSFNIAFDAAEDVVVRASASRVITRPQYVDMYVNPNVTGTNDSLPDNQFWIVGNVGLKPFTSDQIDFAVEWYFDEGSILSGGLFYKKVKNFVTNTSYQASSADIPFNLPDADEAAAGWTVQELGNGGSASIKGLEVQYQQDFGNGFGLLANYTYTDSDVGSDQFTDANKVLTDSSKHSYNVSTYFENDVMNARLSYNWRSQYMLREVGAYGNRLHDDFGSLDLSASYFYDDNITLKLDINNLLKEDSLQYGNNRNASPGSGFINDFPLYQYEGARRVTLGVSFKY
ncbi:TonB-dependent receptor [Temperatibacter marinus]|uniref:TonB-dependent receptor n=1 Tax=Temperatibacter marinus TaxID=1456591 RepID=A0AA52EEM0_9PROT|nr:TonB-dependent receptor [Temperatibacter marinus]WND04082.1 TonB-dependent receptor [Temperatibacter marinus]